MATSKGANTYNRQNWEDAEFPILCQTCLGDNPYIRMLTDKYGKECKICQRPFTVFKWCPGARMRYKKTEICQTCSKLKNVCQTCLLDLEYGLPVQVRDTALAIKDDMPKSDVNKEFYTQNIEKELANTDGTMAGGAVGKAQTKSDLLLKLARTAPYYKRNRPHICSFWVKGECKRGEECPFRHEMPTDPNDPLANQNIKDRYYGTQDPVADKLLKRAASMPKLDPPSDKTITTLYVGGLDGRVTEKDLRDYFYQFGEIRQITMVPRQNCSFVSFTTRAATENAADKSYNKLILRGRRLKILWGKSQGGQSKSGNKEEETKLTPVPFLPGALPPPPVPKTDSESTKDKAAKSTEETSKTDYFGISESESKTAESSASESKEAAPQPPPLLPPPMPPSLPPGLPGFPPPMGLPPPRIPPPRIPPPPPRGLPPPNLPRFLPPPPLPGFPRGLPMPPRLPPPPRMPPPHRGAPPAGFQDIQPAIHYPSQDPHRMGTEKASTS